MRLQTKQQGTDIWMNGRLLCLSEQPVTRLRNGQEIKLSGFAGSQADWQPGMECSYRKAAQRPRGADEDVEENSQMLLAHSLSTDPTILL